MEKQTGMRMEMLKDETAEEYLERIPSFAREKSDLKTVREFLERLGNPDRKMRIFHVAGTNGKGSVCAFLSAVLKEAGVFFGTFTSPHLVDIRERFLVNGAMASKEEFQAAFEAVYETACSFVEEGHVHPTYFEFLFYMAMYLFSKRQVDVLVLETGMGGLKDVTNVIEAPMVSVITSISIDHTAFLGNTTAEIAVHKAGIIKKNCPVVYDTSDEAAAEVIERTAREKNSPGYGIGEVLFSMEGDSLFIEREYSGALCRFEVPFPAPYQAKNAALAVQALSVSGLGIDERIVESGLKKAVWPARMERILPGVYLDGAHNEDGIQAFLTAACLIKKQKRPEKTWLMFSAVGDKKYGQMLKEIGEQLSPDVCLLSRMETKRTLSLEELLAAAREAMPKSAEISCFETSGEALSALFAGRREGDLAFIAGSLYLAGEVKALVAAQQKSGEAEACLAAQDVRTGSKTEETHD